MREGDAVITVLLAVYNGEKYLRAQIDSLLDQTVGNINIVVRDDGSKDRSPDIIAEYASRLPDKISVITGEPTGGAATNFSEMLGRVDDDYIMFADQDDVWFPDKVQRTFEAMLKAENGETDVPVLVHGDLKVTDEGLNVISDSFFDFQKIFPDDLSLNRLLVQNYVTGCTVMINRALKNKALPIPCDVAMHDWWLALVAASFGKIETIRSPLMYYRQHSDNQVGAKAGGGCAMIVRKLRTLGEVKANTAATYRQARLLLNAYGEILTDEKLNLIREYAAMETAGRINKIRTIKRYNFKKCTRLRVLGQYLLA